MNVIEEIRTRAGELGGGVHVVGPQDEATIVQLEAALGVSLPPGYRTFLREFGMAMFGTTAISGVAGADPLMQEGGFLYNDTLLFREDFGLPEKLFVIQANDDGPFCLDMNVRDDRGENPIVVFDMARTDVQTVAPDFFAFVRSLLLSP